MFEAGIEGAIDEEIERRKKGGMRGGIEGKK